MTPNAIRAIRTSLALTRIEMGERLCLSASMVKAMELGQKTPSARTLRDLIALRDEVKTSARK